MLFGAILPRLDQLKPTSVSSFRSRWNESRDHDNGFPCNLDPSCPPVYRHRQIVQEEASVPIRFVSASLFAGQLVAILSRLGKTSGLSVAFSRRWSVTVCSIGPNACSHVACWLALALIRICRGGCLCYGVPLHFCSPTAALVILLSPTSQFSATSY